MNLEAFILGCGGMMPLPHRHLTSVLLRREGELFLFDGGEGTQVSLRRLNLRWKKISAIFISHTHADHVTGIPGLLMLSSQVDRDDPLFIYGPPRIAEYIESSRRVLDMYINYEIVVKEFNEPGVIHQGEGFRIRSFPLRHTKPCFGYTLEEEGRPGIFHPEKAEALGIPRGPLWAKLQAGENITLPGLSCIHPRDVLGPPRSGRKFSFVTDSLASKEIAAEVAGSDL
ncbi:MAG: MBL fold metallo-hydrolase, partial [Treponema sp.]|nr:MBL fold metallo-hydrolase [Treponema sp.]